MSLTIKDLDEIEGRLKDTFVTKEDFTDYKSQLFDKLDQIVQEYFGHQYRNRTYRKPRI